MGRNVPGRRNCCGRRAQQTLPPAAKPVDVAAAAAGAASIHEQVCRGGPRARVDAARIVRQRVMGFRDWPVICVSWGRPGGCSGHSDNAAWRWGGAAV